MKIRMAVFNNISKNIDYSKPYIIDEDFEQYVKKMTDIIETEGKLLFLSDAVEDKVAYVFYGYGALQNCTIYFNKLGSISELTLAKEA